jgi:acetyl esterase/lipase
MKNHSKLLVVLALLAAGCSKPPSDAGSLVYRSVDGRDLAAQVLAPAGTRQGDGKAAIVLIHGGAWSTGSPRKVHPMGRYFVERGMVAVSIEYRLSDMDSITPIEAVEDANAAMVWTRQNAERLGIDPNRIAAGGYSSGGHLSVMAAVSTDGRVPADQRPDALVLWFPSLATHNDEEFLRILQDRGDPEALSPILQVTSRMPPAIVLQGTRDKVAPQGAANRFCSLMRKFGNRCDLHLYKNRGHMFYDDLDDYVDTLLKIDDFLVSLGFLEGEANAEAARSSRDLPESS